MHRIFIATSTLALALVPTCCAGYAVPLDRLSGEPFAAGSPHSYPKTRQESTTQRPLTRRYSRNAGILNATIGIRSQANSSQWEPFEDQFSAGLDYTRLYPGLPFGLSAAIIGTYASESRAVGGTRVSMDVYTAEFAIGPKAIIPLGDAPLEFVIGVGASFLYVAADGVVGSSKRTSNDLVVGGHGTLGLLFHLNETQAIGLEYRGLRGGKATLYGGDRDIDYDQISVVFSTIL